MKKVIVGIGEILWDMLPSGKALGGAPANFAYHAGRLGGDDRDACRALIEAFGLRLVILTRGADGSEVITADEVIPQGVGDVEVVDTVGAGDSFTAAFVVAYLRGDSLAEAQRLASETASYVCSRKGAMPD